VLPAVTLCPIGVPAEERGLLMSITDLGAHLRQEVQRVEPFVDHAAVDAPDVAAQGDVLLVLAENRLAKSGIPRTGY